MNTEIVELIEQRRKQVLVHSYIYYQLNENIVTDYVYDKWCLELFNLQVNYPVEADKAIYAEEFKAFDGTTGYDLPFNTPDINGKAIWLLRIHEEMNRVNVKND